MSHFLNQTSKAVLDKYQGDLENLRKEANRNPAKERELVKEFKVYRRNPFKTIDNYNLPQHDLGISISSLHLSVHVHTSVHVSRRHRSDVLSYISYGSELIYSLLQSEAQQQQYALSTVSSASAACLAADCCFLWPQVKSLSCTCLRMGCVWGNYIEVSMKLLHVKSV